MRISDLLSMALKNLWRRKSRTFLTVLGVLVGSVSVVLMVSIALGTERASMQMIQSFGNIRVISVSAEGGDYMGGQSSAESTSSSSSKKNGLNDETIKQLAQLKNVEAVVPVYQDMFTFTSGRKLTNQYVVGADLEKLQLLGLKLQAGRLPEKGSREFLFGEPMTTSFYDPSDKVYRPEKIEILNQSFRTYYNNTTDKNGNKKRAQNFDAVGQTKNQTEYSYSVLMDIETFKAMKINDIKRYGDYKAYRKKKNKDDYNSIKVLVKDMDHVITVSKEIKEMGFQAQNQMEFVNQMKQQSNMLKLVLGGIGFVSLFVAAIGITNTMVMAIYERTREIGVMKVLGAEVYDILKMFLLEAATIGFIGGIFGLGLAQIGSNMINGIKIGGGMEGPMTGISYIPVWLMIASILFSTLIGVVAGILPAFRATRLSALEALKN